MKPEIKNSIFEEHTKSIKDIEEQLQFAKIKLKILGESDAVAYDKDGNKIDIKTKLKDDIEKLEEELKEAKETEEILNR